MAKAEEFIEIDGKVIRGRVDIMAFKDGDHISSYAPSLDLASQGETEQEALENLRQLIKEVLMYMNEMKNLEQYLHSSGWKFFKTKRSYAHKGYQKIPYELLAHEQFTPTIVHP